MQYKTFSIERNDITKIRADALVNTANPFPVVGMGTDSAIYSAAGKEKLLGARKKIGQIEPGKSAWTESFNLKTNGVRFIIHTVGTPYIDGTNGEESVLRGCYKSALSLAVSLKCKSVALPLLATGFYHFPKELALQVAIDEISKFLLENEMNVTLVVFDDESFGLSEKLFNDIKDFISENYEETGGNERKIYKLSEFPDFEERPKFTSCATRSIQSGRISRSPRQTHAHQVYGANSSGIKENYIESAPNFAPDFDASSASYRKSEILSSDVDSFLKKSGTQNFQNTLQNLIAQKNLSNSAIYRRACIDRRFFSKIISRKNYVPKKQTVMALGLALELSLEEYESFLASAGYAFMPSSKFDLIVKYCVMNKIYNLIKIDFILNEHGLECFSPS